MVTKELESTILRLKIELEKINKNILNNKLVDSSKKKQLINDIVNLEKQL
jgi:hypothetical protein